MYLLFNYTFLVTTPPECGKCELNLGETFLKKKGLASCLLLTCKEFYNSVSNDNSFDINARTVYSMTACGQGYAGLKKLRRHLRIYQNL